MDKRKVAAEFRIAARALQKWVRTNFNILTSDFDSQRELQRLIREVDARATILEFRFPDVDLTGLCQSSVRYWGWCRVPYSLAKTVKNPCYVIHGPMRPDESRLVDSGPNDSQLVDCFSLNCFGEWWRAIDGLVAAADLIAADAESPVTVEDDQIRTIAGDIVLRNELTEEDRPSGEWADICGFSDDTFRNRMKHQAKGATWRIVESGSQRYRVHVEDLPPKFRGSKKQRDEFLKSLKD